MEVTCRSLSICKSAMSTFKIDLDGYTLAVQIMTTCSYEAYMNGLLFTSLQQIKISLLQNQVKLLIIDSMAALVSG